MIKILDRPIWEWIVWIIIIIIVVFALAGEKKLINCFEGTNDCGRDYNWSPQINDQPTDLIYRIEKGKDGYQLIISRRLAMVWALLITMFAFWYFRREFLPKSVIEYLFISALMMGLIWFLLRFQESHYLDVTSHRIQDSINELRYSLDLEQKPENILP